MVAQVFLALALILSVFFDVRERRIPNWVTIPAVAVGLLMGATSQGLTGLAMALAGAAAGAALLALPFAGGWVGGGDLKLLAAVGALMGAPFALWTFVFASAAGGIMALAVMTVNGGLGGPLTYVLTAWTRTASVKPVVLTRTLSFGPALAVGALLARLWVQ